MKSSLLFLASIVLTAMSTNLYKVNKVKYDKGSPSFEAELSYQGKDFNKSQYLTIPIRNETSIDLIKNLKVNIDLLCGSIIHITVRDLHRKRWEVPLGNDDFIQKTASCGKYLSLEEYGLTFEHSPFSFSLDADNITYYTWKEGNLLFSDTLIAFESLLTTDFIFGFGERNAEFKLGNGIYTIWPNDTGITYKDELKGGYNLMGHQPIGLHMVKSDLFVGFIFLNSNPQDVVIQTKNPFTSLEHRTIGGIIDYYIVRGRSADEVIVRILDIVGRPIMPPYWSLGWHHSRWGYSDTNHMRITYQQYRQYNIPLDTMWSDIDILHQYRNFQLDDAFNSIRSFIDELHEDHAKYVPIIDYGIPNSTTDPYYEMGVSLKNAFIMSNFTEEALVSSSWPGSSIILDLFSENGVKVLNKGIQDFDALLNFDGIWLDMNEPGIIDVLPEGRGEKASYYPAHKNKYAYLPYIPGYRKGQSDLETKAVSLNGYSHVNKEFYTMLNIRPLLVREQVRIVNEYLYKTGRRPFIISRANTFGHGKHSFHWLGDNKATFEHMKESVAGSFNYNIFGVPMTGSDICGFHGGTTAELCARWHVLGAMYPFSRNHNAKGQRVQEPWTFINHTLPAALIAVRTKYSLIRYMYSQLYLISLGEKGSFFKPAFFEFPADKELLSHMEDYVMLGSCLYFVPNFSQSQKDYKAYFPNANWNVFPSGNNLMSYNADAEQGMYFYLPGQFDIVNLYLRGGSIVPYQDIAKPFYVKTTHDLRKRPIELIINPNEELSAEGDLFFDNDGKDSLETKDYLHVKVYYALNNIFFTQINTFITDYPYEDIFISKVKFYRKKNIQAQFQENIIQCEVIYGKGAMALVKAVDGCSDDVIVFDMTQFKISLLDIQVITLNYN